MFIIFRIILQVSRITDFWILSIMNLGIFNFLLNSNWFWWTSPFAEMTIGIIWTVFICHIAFIWSARSLYFVILLEKDVFRIWSLGCATSMSFAVLLILSMTITSGHYGYYGYYYYYYHKIRWEIKHFYHSNILVSV
jgi:hypothetical protein